MAIGKKINHYYLDRIKKYDDDIRSAIRTVLGNEFVGLYDVFKEKFTPIFTASKDGLEMYLGETPSADEKEVLEALLDKVGDKDVVILDDSIRSNFNKSWDGFFEDPDAFDAFYRTYHKVSKIDVFYTGRDGLFLDYVYIQKIIVHLVRCYRVKNNIKVDLSDNENKLVSLVLKTISMQIVLLLRSKKIYILDSEEDVKEELCKDDYEILPTYYIEKMSCIFSRLLLCPNVLKETIGSDDFEKIINVCLNGEEFGKDLCDKLDKIPKVELHSYLYKKLFEKDTFTVDDLKIFAKCVIDFIDIYCGGGLGTNLFGFKYETGKLLSENSFPFKNALKNASYHLAVNTGPSSEKKYFPVDCLTLVSSLYSCCGVFIDYLNSRLKRNINIIDTYILELYNFDGNDNCPSSVLLFDINGEYFVIDGFGYLFYKMVYWDSVKDKEFQDWLEEYRSSSAKNNLMMPLDEYLRRKTYFPQCDNPILNKDNFSVSIDIGKSRVYMPNGIDDDRPCSEIPYVSLVDFLNKNKQHNL